MKRSGMMRLGGRLPALAVTIASVTTNAPAALMVMKFDSTINGNSTTSPSAPWVSDTFQDQSDGSVLLTISDNQSFPSSEHLDALLLNFDDRLDLNKLAFSWVCGSACAEQRLAWSLQLCCHA